MKRAFVISLCIAPFLLLAAGGQHGKVEKITLHGKSLEGNLEGDSPDRDVRVYLPPGYDSNKSRRYPVVYLLHGFTDSTAKWFGDVKHWINLPEVLDRASGSGVKEMIVVMPDAFTQYQGSFYSTSATTGDWETYISKELVGYVDSHYRTLASATSRGIAGHSMGGYGAIRIGMRHPEVFSALYAMNPCCLSPGFLTPQSPDAAARIEAIKTPEEAAKAEFGTKAVFAVAAAWSPNPKSPPFYFDLPTRDGKVQPLVIAKWDANMPIAMFDQDTPNLKKLRGIGFDAGDQDIPGIPESAKQMDQMLAAYGIDHAFAIYKGTHISGVAERIEKVAMPFFADKLTF